MIMMISLLLRFLLANVVESFLFRFLHATLDGELHLFSGLRSASCYLSVVFRCRPFLTIIWGIFLSCPFYFFHQPRRQHNLLLLTILISHGSVQRSSYFSSFWIQNWRLFLILVAFCGGVLLKHGFMMDLFLFLLFLSTFKHIVSQWELKILFFHIQSIESIKHEKTIDHFYMIILLI